MALALAIGPPLTTVGRAGRVPPAMCVSEHCAAGARVDESWMRPGKSGESGGRRGRAVSYTHLTLPTICSV
eukprot:2568720-Alexandrium_andersonii.AAC.1